MKLIRLTQDRFTEVDDDDFGWISQYRWHYADGYAVRTSSAVLGKRAKIYMHREILQLFGDMEVDHVDSDGLNNQRKNLRICSAAENQYHRRKQINNTSGYKGVSWHRLRCRWQAQIKANGKKVHLGYFNVIRDAAFAYDDAARMYYGKFSNCNFLLGESENRNDN